MCSNALELDNLLSSLSNFKQYLVNKYGKQSFKIEQVEKYKFMPSSSDAVVFVFRAYDECERFLEYFKIVVM